MKHLNFTKGIFIVFSMVIIFSSCQDEFVNLEEETLAIESRSIISDSEFSNSLVPTDIIIDLDSAPVEDCHRIIDLAVRLSTIIDKGFVLRCNGEIAFQNFRVRIIESEGRCVLQLLADKNDVNFPEQVDCESLCFTSPSPGIPSRPQEVDHCYIGWGCFPYSTFGGVISKPILVVGGAEEIIQSKQLLCDF